MEPRTYGVAPDLSVTQMGVLGAAIPNLFWSQVLFLWMTVFPRTEVGDDLRIIPVYYIYCALYFYHYSISSTSDHQTLDPGSWVPLTLRKLWKDECDGSDPPAWMQKWGAQWCTEFGSFDFWLICPLLYHGGINPCLSRARGRGTQRHFWLSGVMDRAES